jgi:hypothetical protein
MAWILGPHRDQKWEIIRSHPLLIGIYPLMGLALVGALYSYADPRSLRHGFLDALRLGMIPLLLYFYRSEKIAKAALGAFIGAMVLTLVLAFLKVYADFPIGLKFTTGAVFRSHIKTSYFMGMAAFFLALLIKQNPHHRGLLLGLIGGMIYYLFFMNMGRIGYITVLSCGAVLAWQTYQLKGLTIATGLGTLLLLGAYFFSDIFYDRIHLLARDLDVYQHGGDLLASSLGSRISFAMDSVALMKAHPFLGYGTGSFGTAYGLLPQGPDRIFTDNPHNAFLLMGVEFGAIGIGLLLLFFFHQWRLGRYLRLEARQLWQGFFLTFVLGCFINSWLKDSPEAYFYCVITALCFAQVPLRASIPLTTRKQGAH